MLVADYYLAIYLQSVRDDSPLESSVHMLPTTLGMLLSTVTAGGLTQTTGKPMEGTYADMTTKQPYMAVQNLVPLRQVPRQWPSS